MKKETKSIVTTAVTTAAVVGVLLTVSRTEKGKAILNGLVEAVSFSSTLSKIKKLFTGV
jgi:hypothetical protein